MVFSSTFFLCYFLPIFLLLYFIIPVKYRNIFLLLGSCLFYAWGAPKFIFVIIGTTILDFFLVQKMEESKVELRRKLLLIFSISMNLGLLIYFKYSNFFIQNVNHALHMFGATEEIRWTKLVLPIGISFYTFEAITYMVDVYRRVHKPLKNFWDYQLYIILFPKLIAGPIIRYHELADQITDRKANYTSHNKLMGFYRFSIGLGKKVLIANALASFVDGVYGNSESGLVGIDPAFVSSGTMWLTALAYTFQIYFDFSGYCDMAIGLALILGFRFPENFNSPYISESITEFWRRWHITLGAWMRNYLYIPLGGNRVTTKRLYLNLWLVFLLSGLWHGASWNFIIWGVWHGTFLVLERLFLQKLFSRIGRLARIAFTFLIVLVGWVFFRVEYLAQARGYLKAMFFMNHGTQHAETDMQFWITLSLAAFFAFFCIPNVGRKIQEFVYAGMPSSKMHVTMTVIALLLFGIALSYVTSSGYNPFIYFQF